MRITHIAVIFLTRLPMNLLLIKTLRVMINTVVFPNSAVESFAVFILFIYFFFPNIHHATLTRRWCWQQTRRVEKDGCYSLGKN